MRMLRYNIAFDLPHVGGEMVVAEDLNFPGALTQGFDLPGARQMIASAMGDLAQCLLEEGKPLPVPIRLQPLMPALSNWFRFQFKSVAKYHSLIASSRAATVRAILAQLDFL